MFSQRLEMGGTALQAAGLLCGLVQMLSCNRDPSHTLLRLQPLRVNKKGQICININMKWSLFERWSSLKSIQRIMNSFPKEVILNKRTSQLKIQMIILIGRIAFATRLSHTPCTCGRKGRHHYCFFELHLQRSKATLPARVTLCLLLLLAVISHRIELPASQLPSVHTSRMGIACNIETLISTSWSTNLEVSMI